MAGIAYMSYIHIRQKIYEQTRSSCGLSVNFPRVPVTKETPDWQQPWQITCCESLDNHLSSTVFLWWGMVLFFKYSSPHHMSQITPNCMTIIFLVWVIQFRAPLQIFFKSLPSVAYHKSYRVFVLSSVWWVVEVFFKNTSVSQMSQITSFYLAIIFLVLIIQS